MILSGWRCDKNCVGLMLGIPYCRFFEVKLSAKICSKGGRSLSSLKRNKTNLKVYKINVQVYKEDLVARSEPKLLRLGITTWYYDLVLRLGITTRYYARYYDLGITTWYYDSVLRVLRLGITGITTRYYARYYTRYYDLVLRSVLRSVLRIGITIWYYARYYDLVLRSALRSVLWLQYPKNVICLNNTSVSLTISVFSVRREKLAREAAKREESVGLLI